MKFLMVLGFFIHSAFSLAEECIVARIAFDIGSGSTKARSAVVDSCRQKVIKQLEKVSEKISFKQEISKGQGKLDPEFLKQAISKIKALSDDLVNKTQARLATDTEYSYLKDQVIKSAGVATEWIRQVQSSDPDSSVKFLRELRNSFIPVRALSQKEEGRIGFIGVLGMSGFNDQVPSDPFSYLSWDIGGASLQIVGYKQGDLSNTWIEYGNQLASEPMRCFTLTKIIGKSCFETVDGKKVATSPNPILPQVESDNINSEQALDAILNQSVTYVAEQFSNLEERATGLIALASTRKVVGIGGVHGSVIGLLKKVPGKEKVSGYSVSDLRNLLLQTATLTDRELVATFGAHPDFVNGTITNVLMVYAVMKHLKIDYVQVADVDNSFGVAIAPVFWGGKANDRTSDGRQKINP